MTLKEIVVLFFILSFVLFSRLFRLHIPSEMYFDEVYHVPAAMMMSDGDFQTPFSYSPRSYDGQHIIDWLHPPLAKYFQAGSMSFFGKNSLSWRLPSVLMAFSTVLIFYFFLRFFGQNFFWKQESVSKKNDLAINLALTGSFFLSLSGLFLVQSRIAMNDVFLLFFLLVAVFIYFVYLFRKSYKFLFLSSVFFGLALSSKWTALWIILLLFFRELSKISNFRKLPFLFFCFFFTPFFIYLLSYLPMFLNGANINDFLVLQKNIVLSQLHNPNIHLYSSDPLSWWLNLRPVWFFANLGGNLQAGWIANIYALENPLLSLYLSLTFILIVISLLKKDQNSLSRKTIWLLFGFYLASFLPWIFFSRPMFLHHYLPALPFLISIMSYLLLSSLKKITNQAKRRAWTFNLLFWPFFFFIIFYPHWTALPVPSDFANAVYFFVPNWR